MEDSDLATAGGMVVWGKLISSPVAFTGKQCTWRYRSKGLLGKVCHSAALPAQLRPSFTKEEPGV